MSVLKLQSDLLGTSTGVTCEVTNGFRLHVDILESWLCRVALIPDRGLDVPNTWMIAPHGEVPWEGQPRLAVEEFTCPATHLNGARLESDTIGINITNESSLAIEFQQKTNGAWNSVLQDRAQAAYRYLDGRGLMQHSQLRSTDHKHLGLGDKAGTIDRTGKRFRCLQTDALGYDAEHSDPLYKHVPWVIVGNAHSGYCGMFYDTMSECAFDLGAEHSNYYSHSRSVEVFEKGLVYYLVFGPSVKEVVPRFQKLTGLPHLQPRWGLGFAFTSMHHADDDNAQQVMLDFVDACAERDIPISALHSGSGYTMRSDKRRYVFTWNRDKFPDTQSFFSSLSDSGLKTCANIKPVLLKEHPAFEEVSSFNGFLTNGSGEPAIEMFWGGLGASLDFTNPKTVQWWQQGIKEQVVGVGFTAVWNDNNECEIWDEQAQLHGFGSPLNAMNVRPLQAMLMTRASYEVTKDIKADERPYTITRAGPAGISRYAQTWTGDNETSWHTLRWNLSNGLSLSLSGFPFVGHDIGGFSGAKPSAELLCRWFEMMVLHPRALMNSWKPEEQGAEAERANLPWMHESVTDLIRDNLNLRYLLLPMLYHLTWKSHTQGSPVIAPMLYYFNEPACQRELTQFMFGADLLVAPVVEEGATSKCVVLPKVKGGWYYWRPTTGLDVIEHYQGGGEVDVVAPLGTLPLFVRAGAVLALATKSDSLRPHDANEITLLGFASGANMVVEQHFFYDDGISWEYQDNPNCMYKALFDCRADAASLTVDSRSVEHAVSIKSAVVGGK